MNRFELYINNQRADIDPEAPVLFNYAVEDLRNPSIVKNSYSKQLKLQGTPANDQIFQRYFRADARPGNGFDPAKRVPFTIFADGSRVVESGYARLDSVQRTGPSVVYAVTLFGGLGGFLYALQNDAVGNARTLSDLVFLDDQRNPVDLDFTINRAAVRAAWAQLLGGAVSHKRWDIINFAPCYNGIPDKFDASHALVRAFNAGLATHAYRRQVDGAYDTEDLKDPPADMTGVTEYEARGGWALVDLPEDKTEWQVNDLRSYHQRPVIKVAEVIKAICERVNNGGYDVTLDPGFFNANNPYWTKTWMTLKQLSSIKLKPTRDEVYQYSINGVDRHPFDWAALPQLATSSMTVWVYPQKFTLANQANRTLYWGFSDDYYDNHYIYRGIAFQAVAYDVNDRPIAGSHVVVFTAARAGADLATNGQWTGSKQFCEAAVFDVGQQRGQPFRPRFDTGEGEGMYDGIRTGTFTAAGTIATFVDDSGSESAVLSMANVPGAALVRVFADRVSVRASFTDEGTGVWGYLQQIPVGGTGDSTAVVGVNVSNTYASLSWSYTTWDAVRTDTAITKQMLLDATMSPADFLLSYCKRFGLMLTIDPVTKKVTIRRRQEFYRDEVADIDALIDRGRAFVVKPVPCEVARFDFREESAGAAFAKDYEARYGRPYGSVALATGYEFNADTKTLPDAKFKMAPEVKEQAVEFVTVGNGTGADPSRPAVFLLSGLTYHLFQAGGNGLNDMTVPIVPAGSSLQYFDSLNRGYDKVTRLQLHTEDGKGVDGDGVLVFLQGSGEVARGQEVSDDLPAMYYASREKPCWILDSRQAYNSQQALVIPYFGRFLYYENSARTNVETSLEFGVPVEVDTPQIVVAHSIVVDVLYRYMADRFSPKTKVVTCYVATATLPEGPEALRRFYWFDGTLWALNKIHDYDLNKPGLTKCEFVQVQDKANYLND